MPSKKRRCSSTTSELASRSVKRHRTATGSAYKHKAASDRLPVKKLLTDLPTEVLLQILHLTLPTSNAITNLGLVTQTPWKPHIEFGLWSPLQINNVLGRIASDIMTAELPWCKIDVFHLPTDEFHIIDGWAIHDVEELFKHRLMSCFPFRAILQVPEKDRALIRPAVEIELYTPGAKFAANYIKHSVCVMLDLRNIIALLYHLANSPCGTMDYPRVKIRLNETHRHRVVQQHFLAIVEALLHSMVEVSFQNEAAVIFTKQLTELKTKVETDLRVTTSVEAYRTHETSILLASSHLLIEGFDAEAMTLLQVGLLSSDVRTKAFNCLSEQTRALCKFDLQLQIISWRIQLLGHLARRNMMITQLKQGNIRNIRHVEQFLPAPDTFSRLLRKGVATAASFQDQHIDYVLRAEWEILLGHIEASSSTQKKDSYQDDMTNKEEKKLLCAETHLFCANKVYPTEHSIRLLAYVQDRLHMRMDGRRFIYRTFTVPDHLLVEGVPGVYAGAPGYILAVETTFSGITSPKQVPGRVILSDAEREICDSADIWECFEAREDVLGVVGGLRSQDLAQLRNNKHRLDEMMEIYNATSMREDP